MVNIGNRIREVRERKEITQAELARRLGIDRSYIANIEKGRRVPSLWRARAIARALGVSLDYLAGTFESDQMGAVVCTP